MQNTGRSRKHKAEQRIQTQKSTVKSHLCQAHNQAKPICDVRSQDSGPFVGQWLEDSRGAAQVLSLCPGTVAVAVDMLAIP